MDDDVPQDGPTDPTVRPRKPGLDLRLVGAGGVTWTVGLPGETGELSYEEPAAPPPEWFDPPDTDG